MQRTLNLGILAHVDAGKTTLTERLLHAAGVIDEIGSVDDGTTQTDSLALERQRGITIKSAVVSFVLPGADETTVNLIDTPGHPDFIAEVERVLNVLDGVVLVISAVEGVQAQTRVLMRTLQRLELPTLMFVNKIDRVGARPDDVLDEIRDKLTPAVVAMGAARTLGTRDAEVVPFATDDPDFTARLADALAERDDDLLRAYVDDDGSIAPHRLWATLVRQTKQAVVHPVYVGSAVTGAGVPELTTALGELLPASAGDRTGPVSGTVFKVDRGPAGEKVAYVRVFSGTLRVRDRLGGTVGDDDGQKVTAISVFADGSDVQGLAVSAGQIGKVWGLADVRIGDAIGEPVGPSREHYFAPPTLETVVVPARSSEKGALHSALAQLAEQDPLIDLRQDDVRQELFVSLYGEVQKEVIRDTLRTDFGIDVEFRETTTICVERPIGTGEAVEFLRVRPNPFLATVGLRIEPAPCGAGVRYELERHVLGTMPVAFFRAVEDTVMKTLEQGIHGWRVTDCAITLTHTGYAPRQSAMHQKFNKSMSSTGFDFRGLTPLVVMTALTRARTVVCEPIHTFDLETPSETLGTILPALSAMRAIPLTQTAGAASTIVRGEIPAARVHELRLQLRALTHGEGVLECTFDRYEPTHGPPPTRPRADNNPLDRKEYLLHVLRGV